MFGDRYNSSKFKKNLQLAIVRLELLVRKTNEISRKLMGDIANLCSSGNFESAALKVETIIRNDLLVQCYERLGHLMELVVTRISSFDSNLMCESSLLQSVVTILWCYPRLRDNIIELKPICEQIIIKFGKKFVENVLTMESGQLPNQVVKALTSLNPTGTDIDFYLRNICQAFKVEYNTPTFISNQIISEKLNTIKPVEHFENPEKNVEPLTRKTSIFNKNKKMKEEFEENFKPITNVDLNFLNKFDKENDIFFADDPKIIDEKPLKDENKIQETDDKNKQTIFVNDVKERKGSSKIDDIFKEYFEMAGFPFEKTENVSHGSPPPYEKCESDCSSNSNSSEFRFNKIAKPPIEYDEEIQVDDLAKQLANLYPKK